MRFGLVYDLREDYRALGFSEEAVAEFDSPDTIDALAAALEGFGHAVERIGHIRRLAERLVAGDRWDLVFNIAEGVKGRCREAQVPALLEAYGVPCVFSDALVMAVCLDKAVAKRLVREAGIATPAFAVLESARDAARIALPYPLFVKPIAEGTSKGCDRASIVRNPAELRTIARALIARFRQPALAEAFLPGREFTIGILGNGAAARVIGVLEIELLAGADSWVYSLANKEECESRVRYTLAGDAEARRAGQVALAAYRALGCCDAARIDVRSDAEGNPSFIEANPLAGLHPTHSDLPILAALAGIGYRQLIGGIVQAAAARHGLGNAQRRIAAA